MNVHLNRNKWIDAINELDFAFQPLVNPQTGNTYAVETLLRNVDAAGFGTIGEFFDGAFHEGVLFTVDVELRRKAVRKFMQIPCYEKIRLFYNYDPRIHIMGNYHFGATENILREAGLRNESICLELSEQHKCEPYDAFKATFDNMKQRGFRIALDDFGVGFSSMELFYNAEPDFLKFDRFLISQIDRDSKKRSFCSHLIGLAKLYGVIVIAEGVETSMEFDSCKRLGFDLVQGYFIQRPVMDPAGIGFINPVVREFNSMDKRKSSPDRELITREIRGIETVRESDSFETLLAKFHDNPGSSFFPVLDAGGYPLGIIHERDIKKYIYSPFGYNILTNRSLSATLKKFLVKCPIADINTSQESILENLMHYPETDGVIVTRDMKYTGFLTPHSLLKIINEKNLSNARELNPLTKLPGNVLISRYISSTGAEERGYHYFIYFDFDNFKPFNDRFGFRQGDRAILVFADILKKVFYLRKFFIGHIGGDDFFVAFGSEKESAEYIEELARITIDSFMDSIISLYSEEEYARGRYLSKNRDGESGEFPLLSAYAAVLEVNHASVVPGDEYQDVISLKLAEIKKNAKQSQNKISIYYLTEMN